MPRQGWTLGLALAAGCTSMQAVEPAQFIPQHKPVEVTVWTAHDDVTVVSNPWITRDTLRGDVFDEPWAVALRSVVRVEAIASDVKKTVLLIAGSAAAAAGIYLISNTGTNNGVSPCPPAECGQTVLPQ